MSIRIALVGNPNAGKTTLFNALTGSNQSVGNWPGVTVEKKEGALKTNKDFIVTDLPGIYSLSPYTPEEVVSRNYLLNEKPDVILNIIDGTNLERNLYLTTQLLEIGIPVVLAINMIDAVEKRGDSIDTEKLSKRLGCAVVSISALKGVGIQEVVATITDIKNLKEVKAKTCFHGAVEHALAHIEERLLHDKKETEQRFYAIKLFERDVHAMESLRLSTKDKEHIEHDIQTCEAEMEDDAESIIINQRYTYVEQIVDECCIKKHRNGLETSQKIDRIVTNRWLALPIFACIMMLVYYISVTSVGGVVTDWVNDGLFGEGFYIFDKFVYGLPVMIETWLQMWQVAPWMQSLLLDGIVAGVGAVLGFAPQIMVLFFFLSILESSGYMSRIAFILDKIFRRFGLSGKSFIPMLVTTGCGVPGVMASRTIENQRDRRMTIMTTNFVPCGAKLPLIAMIAGAFFDGAWWVAPSAYFMGVMAVLLSGAMLKKTRLFAGKEEPFVMELPLYHMPLAKHVLRSTGERTWSFVKKAGTVILLASVVVWFASNFAWIDGRFIMLTEDELSLSILSQIGQMIAWMFIPLGFGTWQATVASMLGLVAKETVVSTMGVLYGFSEGGYEVLSQVFTSGAAYAFMAFNLLCIPCLAAVAAIFKEMNDKRWFFFSLLYQTLFAYAVAFCIYQLWSFVTGGLFTVATGIAVVIVIAVIFVLLRPQSNR